MADAVTTQTIHDGSKVLIQKFTNVSDGTGESAVAKVDVSALSQGSGSPKILKCYYMTSGMAVDMYFDATANVLALSIPENQVGTLDFTSFGGIANNAGSGVTGDILFTTRGHTTGDTYSIVLEMAWS